MRDTKTDNRNLEAKLNLRREFLDKYHPGGGIKVFDAFQGSGSIWRELRSEYGDKISSYWGVDVKPLKGRIKIDSLRILQSGLTEENVIDLDCYGMPWKYYFEACKHISQPTTIFLTNGMPGQGTSRCYIVEEAIGIRDLNPLPVLSSRAAKNLGARYCLSRLSGSNTIVEASLVRVAIGSMTDTRYYAVRLEPN